MVTATHVKKFNGVGVTSLIVGVALMILGYRIYSINSSHAALCSSGVGQLGQALSSQVVSLCSSAHNGEYLGGALFVIGFLALIVTRKQGIIKVVPK